MYTLYNVVFFLKSTYLYACEYGNNKETHTNTNTYEQKKRKRKHFTVYSLERIFIQQ